MRQDYGVVVFESRINELGNLLLWLSMVLRRLRGWIPCFFLPSVRSADNEATRYGFGVLSLDCRSLAKEVPLRISIGILNFEFKETREDNYQRLRWEGWSRGGHILNDFVWEAIDCGSSNLYTIFMTSSSSIFTCLESEVNIVMSSLISWAIIYGIGSLRHTLTHALRNKNSRNTFCRNYISPEALDKTTIVEIAIWAIRWSICGNKVFVLTVYWMIDVVDSRRDGGGQRFVGTICYSRVEVGETTSVPRFVDSVILQRECEWTVSWRTGQIDHVKVTEFTRTW